MRLIDADALPRHGKRGGIVHWKDIENAPTIEAEPSKIARDIATILENEMDMRVMLNRDWIPVTERLPEQRQSVIISTKEWTGEGCYWETTEHHVIWKGYRWNATYWDDEVIAWKPLPKPYKEN